MSVLQSPEQLGCRFGFRVALPSVSPRKEHQHSALQIGFPGLMARYQSERVYGVGRDVGW